MHPGGGAGLMHPGAWIVWALGGAVVALATTNPVYLFLLFAVAFLVRSACARRGDDGRTWRLFVTFGICAIVLRTALVALGPVSSGAVLGAALEGLRIAVLLALFGAYNSVTDPSGLLRLAPRRFHEAALAASLALSLAPRTIASIARVREAQRMRGIHIARWRSLPALAVPVLATGMEEAVTLAESMDARGHGRGRRSRYRIERFGMVSWAAAVIALVGAVVFVAVAGGSAADAEVSWAGVGAVAALAAPAARGERRDRVRRLARPGGRGD